MAWSQGHARLASLTDVQMEIHKAEAAALRDTLHVLSHEIMNSLTPVASLAEIADSYLATAPVEIAPAREALETLGRRAAGLTRFIEAYRSIARLPDPVFQSTHPAQVVEAILDLFRGAASEPPVTFVLDADTNLPRIDLDEAQVSQAIINVVTNAIEATQGVARPHIAVSMRESRRTIVIRVSDNGHGVAEEVRPNLFSGFVSTKASGTGTGLTLARQIALSHGGNLYLEASTPDGTTFAFTFPLRS